MPKTLSLPFLSLTKNNTLSFPTRISRIPCGPLCLQFLCFNRINHPPVAAYYVVESFVQTSWLCRIAQAWSRSSLSAFSDPYSYCGGGLIIISRSEQHPATVIFSEIEAGSSERDRNDSLGTQIFQCLKDGDPSWYVVKFVSLIPVIDHNLESLDWFQHLSMR